MDTEIHQPIEYAVVDKSKKKKKKVDNQVKVIALYAQLVEYLISPYVCLDITLLYTDMHL